MVSWTLRVIFAVVRLAVHCETAGTAWALERALEQRDAALTQRNTRVEELPDGSRAGSGVAENPTHVVETIVVGHDQAWAVRSLTARKDRP